MKLKSILIRVVAILIFVGVAVAARYVYIHHGKVRTSGAEDTITYNTTVSPSAFALPSSVDPNIEGIDGSSTFEIQEVNVIPEAAEKVEVVWVSDGDTYIVNWHDEEVTVRLIGVDTPESVASEEYQEKSGKKNTAEGKAASNVMKEKLPKGSFIYILPGKEPVDLYGRSLVYAWFEDGTMIEDFLLINDYAKILEIPPNTEYSEHFREVAA